MYLSEVFWNLPKNYSIKFFNYVYSRSISNSALRSLGKTASELQKHQESLSLSFQKFTRISSLKVDFSLHGVVVHWKKIASIGLTSYFCLRSFVSLSVNLWQVASHRKLTATLVSHDWLRPHNISILEAHWDKVFVASIQLYSQFTEKWFTKHQKLLINSCWNRKKRDSF